MDPFIGGALISAGGSLLGGLLDRKASKNATGREMAQKIETGARYGLHPLASIGAQTSGYQPVYSQAFTSAGQAIQGGMSARADARADRRRERTQERLAEAQIAEAQSRTILNAANARRALVGPGAPRDPYAMRQENALMSVRLENGDVVQVPNPDVYEISPTELATGRIVLEGGRALERQDNGGWKETDSQRQGTGVGGTRGSLR